MAELRISTGFAGVDLDVVHGFLSRDAYWCRGITRDRVERAARHSLCFSALLDGAQVGFARVVTDHATFGYLADVFVLPGHRGQGISQAMMAAILAHPELQGLRRFLLATSDAHGLYAKYDFKPITRPERFMERYRPDSHLE
ncbi:MAG: GNAT family N-acetyltransferase [Arenimonas sp.]|uniref:GNAT family N-acetyltransferase n=1 Tax=Arenimonas sp. TaxID=1872635 RepID=UPI0025C268D6|nr:GNAT family N-acetyltransferase [Arenimonas sp.]MBW8367447.1 GNAT family N-acetyltransferase [Arenimonas sp.]